MSLMDAIGGELPFLRAEAESRMLDTFDIQESNGVTYNPATGEDEETFTTLLSDVKGRVKVVGAYVLEQQVGGRTATTSTREFHVSVTTPAMPTGAFALCTAVDPTSDPTLMGARLRLAGPVPGSQTTARRLQVTEVLT